MCSLATFHLVSHAFSVHDEKIEWKMHGVWYDVWRRTPVHTSAHGKFARFMCSYAPCVMLLRLSQVLAACNTFTASPPPHIHHIIILYVWIFVDAKQKKKKWQSNFICTRKKGTTFTQMRILHVNWIYSCVPCHTSYMKDELFRKLITSAVRTANHCAFGVHFPQIGCGLVSPAYANRFKSRPEMNLRTAIFNLRSNSIEWLVITDCEVYLAPNLFSHAYEKEKKRTKNIFTQLNSSQGYWFHCGRLRWSHYFVATNACSHVFGISFL